MTLRLAYNTNGLGSHRLEDALALLAEAGYDGVALTLDPVHLDPLRAGPGDVARVRRLLRDHGLACAVETGGRFVLDPRRKHFPPLDHPDPLLRMQRADLYRRCLDIAADLGAEAVTLATGPRAPGQDPAAAQAFLEDALAALCARADELALALALEPEPGHGVATLAQWGALAAALPSLRLALDVGHVGVDDPAEGPAAAAVAAHAHALATVHLDDAPRGRHEHLPFGQGDLDLPAVIAALRAARFGGLCAVELSRDGHRAHELVPASLAALVAAGARG